MELMKKNLFCSECGAKISQGSKSCPNCDTSIANPETKTSGNRGCISLMVTAGVTIVVTFVLLIIGLIILVETL